MTAAKGPIGGFRDVQGTLLTNMARTLENVLDRGGKLELSDFPAVIGPVQKGLPLAGTTQKITCCTVHPHLCDVAPKGFPALDLALVLFRQAATHVVTAIPLEPATRIVWMNPSFLLPL